MLEYFDYMFTIVFILEAMAKILANGLINCGKKSYLRQTWNVFDLSIIIITVSEG
jgi:hypothetical protein